MTDPAPSLVWLRDDLRLDDNPALAAAVACGAPLVIAYVLEEDPRLRPAGGAVRWWLHHALTALSGRLGTLGQRLVLAAGRSEAILPGLADAAGAGAVFWNRRYGPGTVVDDAVASALRRRNIGVATFKANLLHEPDEIPGTDGGPVKVYGAFRRKALALPSPAGPTAAPTHLPPPVPDVDGLSLADLDLLPRAPDWAGGLRATWTPGEAGAHDALAHFLSAGVKGYAEGRDFPARPSTSRLSPHLRFGEISPARIVAAVGDASGADAAKFLDELRWREFAWHVLGHVPGMAEQNLRPEFDSFPWGDPSKDDLAAWRTGMTGYPIVDAGMRELWHTGWMHNRVRMIVASFLTKHLLIDWRVGEAWFWDTLVDADAANNPFGWQWVAGSGFDAQPYFRIFNPILQGEKFDPDGAYVRRWVPEIAALPDRFLHRPWEASPLELASAGLRLGRDYPEPVIDHGFARTRALAAFEDMRRAAGTA